MLSKNSNENDPVLTRSNSNHDISLNRFAIKSSNVILEDYFEPTEAIILIENGKIFDVIIPKETEEEVLNTLYKEWEIEDHGNLYVFPGLIDSNVHLHVDFNSEWENISYCTEAAASGGVTTIIDNPSMGKPSTSGREYVNLLEKRINKLKLESKVDFGVFGALEPKTKENVQEILELGAMGLKCYLLNCVQPGMENFSSETFPRALEELEKYQDLLLVIHPEIATERELYLTSPCRATSLETRLDINYVIKSIELGGAANKGSYLDELCKKSTCKEDDEDDDCPTPTIDTPSKLKSRVQKTKEKTEIDDIVHFELLSYSYENQKNSDDSSSDSDGDNSKHRPKFQTLPVCLEVGDNQEEDNKENQGRTIQMSLKRSIFSKTKSNNSTEDSQNNKERERELQSENEETVLGEIQVQSNEENLSPMSIIEKPVRRPQNIQIIKLKPLFQNSCESIGEMQPKVGGFEVNKTLTQTRKLLTSFIAADTKGNHEKKISINHQPLMNLGRTENDEPKESGKAKSTSALVSQASKLSSNLGDSPQGNDAKSVIFSPNLSNRPGTPASSSLLQRRMSRKSSNGVAISAASTMSSPSSDFSKVNSLDVIRSGRALAQKDAQYNQSYRIFLANRPQSWEENAVSIVLGSLTPKSSLRIMLPNLSLASSLLKVRQKKKSNEVFLKRIFSDVSAAHLFCNEKMVKKGDTKFKVSPPFRNKENRRLLVDNFRLGGVDVLSSYHFFVPPRFKQVDDGNFRKAFGGLDSMGCTLQATWTAIFSHQQKTNKKFSEDLLYQKKIVNHIIRQMYKSLCFNPAQMLRISQHKGTIAKGRDADLVLWDPYRITENNNLNPGHVFAGKPLLGVVRQTYLRGNLIFDKNNGDRVKRDYRSEFIKP